MQQVATFEKVSLEQYLLDRFLCMGIDPVPAAIETEKRNSLKIEDFVTPNPDMMEFFRKEWEDIKLPCRATVGSAGYDFFLPDEKKWTGGIPTSIQTGIRVKLEPGWVLLLVPRSGLGFRYGLRMVNTVGVIDSDYYGAKNEGHIMAKMISDTYLKLDQGDRFMQGLIVPYGIATNDSDASFAVREGGFGSTGG